MAPIYISIDFITLQKKKKKWVMSNNNNNNNSYNIINITLIV